jgi:hypothetical protein
MAPAVSLDSSDPFRFFRGGGRRLVNFTVTNRCNAGPVRRPLECAVALPAGRHGRPNRGNLLSAIKRKYIFY